MCRKYLPEVSYQHVCKRMGLAPGFRAPLRVQAPPIRGLSYGNVGDSSTSTVSGLNRFMLGRTNHTGSDIRIVSGDIVSAKTYPRQSVEPSWWAWDILFRSLWQRSEHITVLELRGVLLAVKYYVLNLHALDSRIFHSTDSYVAMSIISKGRSASKKISWALKQLNALLLLFNLQLVVAHVDSTVNPTDGASRA